MPHSKKRSKQRWSHANWRLVAFFIAGIALSPVAYFAADAFARVTVDNQLHISASVGSIGGVVGATQYLYQDGYRIVIKNGIGQLAGMVGIAPGLNPYENVGTKQAMQSIKSIVTAIGGVVTGVKVCPYKGWGTSCTVSNFTMRRGRHYTFDGMKEVVYPSPLVDVGWGLDPSGTTKIFYKYSIDAMNMWLEPVPLDDYSFGASWYMGAGALEDYTCPKFALQLPSTAAVPRFTYIDGYSEGNGSVDWNRDNPAPIYSENSVYCILDHNSRQVVKLRVNSIATTSMNVSLQWAGSTGLQTYGCADGLCNRAVHDYCVGCTTAHLALAKQDLINRTSAKWCADALLRPPTIRAMTRVIYPDMPGSGSEYGGTRDGWASMVMGFEGVLRPNETRIVNAADLRVTLHEMVHQYTHTMVTTGIQSWLDEGLSIAVARALGASGTCGPQAGTDFWRSPTYAGIQNGERDPATLGGHELGGAFFEGLEKDYACDAGCMFSIWNGFANYYMGGQGRPSIAAITNIIRTSVGINPTNLMKFLKIDANDQ